MSEQELGEILSEEVKRLWANTEQRWTDDSSLAFHDWAINPLIWCLEAPGYAKSSFEYEMYKLDEQLNDSYDVLSRLR